MESQKVTKERIIFEDLRQTDDLDVERFVHAMLNLQETMQDLDTKQVKATVTLDEDKPIGLCFWGDWHIGGVGVDYAVFKQQLQTIAETDGLYVIGMGDYKDNYLPNIHPAAGLEQIIQPGMQDRVVLHYMSQIGSKTLALVRGCHDDWDKKQGDKDFISTCCESAGKAINFWHGGTLTVNIGSQSYKGHIRHKYKYESSINTTNAQRRMMEQFGPADFAALAHLHNPEANERYLMGAYRWLIRSGGNKVWDEFGQKIGGYKGKPGIPMLIFDPHEHSITGHRDMYSGLDQLRGKRA